MQGEAWGSFFEGLSRTRTANQGGAQPNSSSLRIAEMGRSVLRPYKILVNGTQGQGAISDG